MIQIVIAFIGMILLAIYGWGTYYYRKIKGNSISIISPISHKEKGATIINEPQKIKSDKNDSRKS